MTGEEIDLLRDARDCFVGNFEYIKKYTLCILIIETFLGK